MGKELNQVKKGTATFNLVGKAKVSDFTFKLDVESSKADSDWVYNQLNLGVDCGENGVIYADMMAGYGTSRENTIRVHGKKTDDNGRTQDDFKSMFTIDWEDRFDKEIIDTVGDMCFVTVGLEKEGDKTVYKKFLSSYDAIKYIEENLENDTVINVKGDLKYSVYNDNTQVKKEITSIVLSKAEEKDFRATFTQALLLDADAIGKLDRETNIVPITAKVVDYMKECQDKSLKHTVNGKTVNGMNMPIVKAFDFQMCEDMDKAKKMLKVFKVKGKKITQLVVDGYFTKGEINTTSVTEDDIPDDIKELIDLGYVDKEQILGQIALKNGGKKPEKMVIQKPHIKFSGEDVKMPSVDKIVDLYEEDDVNIALILKSIGATEVKDNTVNDTDKDATEDDLDKALDSEANGDEDEDWLNNL
jgi:hypothetical protein